MYLNIAAAVVQLLMLLGLVWLCLLYPEAVGSYVGPWGRHHINEAMPPFLVRGGAFVMLTLPPVVTALIR